MLTLTHFLTVARAAGITVAGLPRLDESGRDSIRLGVTGGRILVMTREEQPVRAWIRTVFRHAAMQWFVAQHRQYSPNLVWEPGEEEESFWVRDPHYPDSDIEVSV